jgi:hypothetical protein
MSNALAVDRASSLIDDGRSATATFSPCRTYRYALTRRWSERPLAVFVMLNPSTADAFTLDPTVRRCISFAVEWAAGGVLVLNLFALRSTDPKALYSHADPVGPDNDVVITEHLPTGEPAGPVIAAWGAGPDGPRPARRMLRSRAERVAALLRARGARPLCLGLTQAGHPRHPLYIPNGTAAVDLPGGGA